MTSQKKAYLTGDEAKQRRQEFEVEIHPYLLKFYLVDGVLIIQMEDVTNWKTFSGKLDLYDLKENKDMESYFDSPVKMHTYLEKYHTKLKVNKDFQLCIPVELEGKDKPAQLLIKMTKHKEDINEAMLKRVIKMSKDVLQLKEEIMKKKIDVIALDNFVIDHQSIKFSFFQKTKNTLVKISNANYFNPCFGLEIKPKTKFRYKIHQVNAVSNHIIYGIGSNQIREANNQQDGGYFVGFYPGANRFCPQSQAPTATFTNGQTLETEVDLINFTIAFYRTGQLIGNVSIPEAMKKQAIFPVIMMYGVNDTIQLVIQ